jgi:hypothetical protein
VNHGPAASINRHQIELHFLDAHARIVERFTRGQWDASAVFARARGTRSTAALMPVVGLPTAAASNRRLPLTAPGSPQLDASRRHGLSNRSRDGLTAPHLTPARPQCPTKKARRQVSPVPAPSRLIAKTTPNVFMAGPNSATRRSRVRRPRGHRGDTAAQRDQQDQVGGGPERQPGRQEGQPAIARPSPAWSRRTSCPTGTSPAGRRRSPMPSNLALVGRSSPSAARLRALVH